MIILQSAEQPQHQQTQYVQVGGQSKSSHDLISCNFFSSCIVLQLSNIQTTQQPQTITIPAGALQLGGNGQQIVQLATPTKTQTATTANSQNGTVIMVNACRRLDRLIVSYVHFRWYRVIPDSYRLFKCNKVA